MATVIGDERDLARVFLFSRQYTITDSAASAMNKIPDLAELTPEQLDMCHMFAIAKNNNMDTNIQGWIQAARNNLGAIPPNYRQVALYYMRLRRLGSCLAAG